MLSAFPPPMQLRSALRLLAWLALAVAAVARGDDPAAQMRARYAALGPRLAQSPFQRPIVLESDQGAGILRGEVHAVVGYPYAAVAAALESAAQWCDILILHLNVKYCHALPGRPHSLITLRVGRKSEQALEQTSQADFDFSVAGAAPDYLRVQLRAESGPFGTSDYRILLEAVPVDGGRTFIRFAYSYADSFLASLAMRGYLATVGSDKVGFTVVGRQPDGQTAYVGDVRGVVERNTMRYFLAIEAYLAALALPPERRFEARIAHWYAATERYPRQLHELERDEYLEMKRREYRRMQEGR